MGYGGRVIHLGAGVEGRMGQGVIIIVYLRLIGSLDIAVGDSDI